jgi:predicted secreted hydrolase
LGRDDHVDLVIHSAEASILGSVYPLAWSVDAPKQTLELTCEREFPCGEVDIRVSYHGPITSTLCGVYRSRSDAQSDQKYMLVTQFEV